MLRTRLTIGARRVKFGMEGPYPFEISVMYFLSGKNYNMTALQNFEAIIVCDEERIEGLQLG
jgi:hypothetical protein